MKKKQLAFFQFPKMKKMVCGEYPPNSKRKKEKLVVSEQIWKAMNKKIMLIDLEQQQELADSIQPLTLIEQIIQQGQLNTDTEQFLFSILTLYCKKDPLYFDVQKQVAQFIKNKIRNKTLSTLQSQSHSKQTNICKAQFKQAYKQQQNQSYFQNSTLSQKLRKSNYGAKKQIDISRKNLRSIIKVPFQSGQSTILNRLQQSLVTRLDMQQEVDRYIHQISSFTSQFNQFLQQMSIEIPKPDIKEQVKGFAVSIKLIFQNVHTDFVQKIYTATGKGLNKKDAKQQAAKQMLIKIVQQNPNMLKQYIKKLESKSLRFL